jgi:hypothetical protein
LYSTTTYGGTSSDCGNYGCGTVFELLRSASGKWTEKVLYDFNGSGGECPSAGLIFDAAGNLYGTAAGGSSSDCGAEGSCGAVFEVTP